MVRTSDHQDVTNLIFVYHLSQMENPKVEEIVQEIYGDTPQTWLKHDRDGIFPLDEHDRISCIRKAMG